MIQMNKKCACTHSTVQIHSMSQIKLSEKTLQKPSIIHQNTPKLYLIDYYIIPTQYPYGYIDILFITPEKPSPFIVNP